MLVLTRKPGESIVIAEGIVVTVLSVEGGIVKIGIAAARDVPIIRAELIARTLPKSPQPPNDECKAGGTLYAFSEC